MAINFEDDVARRLWDAADSKVPCGPIRGDLGEENISGAYRVQHANAKKRIGNGDALVGFKVGMTSVAVRKQLGYLAPNYGHLFASCGFQDGASIPNRTLIQPRAEGEIAFVLKNDLDAADLQLAEVIASVDYAVCAIELLDSRIAGWNIGPVDSIADNGCGGAYVLGASPRKLTEFNLTNCRMVGRRNGQISTCGVGSASMNNPLLAVRWLAEKLAQTDRSLKAGDIVLSGSLGVIVPLVSGDSFDVEIEGLGSVSVNLK